MSHLYYPIFVDLRGRRCAVVGGGSVAERKVRALLDCGAAVRVISPTLTEALQSLVEGATITYVPRGYKRGDLAGSFLVIAASDDPAVNSGVWEEAGGLGMLANVADQPEKCNFILPSVLRRGGLTVAVGTGGASPALAKRIRTELEKRIGPEYAQYVKVLELWRAAVLRAVSDPGRRRELLRSAAEDDRLVERLRAGESPEALVVELGREFGLDSNLAGGEAQGGNG
jgi:precorrin-2 dehydrogenase/sirohydrochlorin ferrochelatase